MGGLDHVSRMDVVVVSDVSVVILLQSHHEGDEGVCGDLEGLEKLSLLIGGAKVSSCSILISPKQFNTTYTYIHKIYKLLICVIYII